tara:strand:+ start:5145 stop:5819 length:675 start_codon:yes stop_codon:yes gene_type:complete
MSKLAGNEPIELNGREIGTVSDFWSWAYSDLKEPTNRGDFAEYLIYLALKSKLSHEYYETRMDWDVVDFVYGKGIAEDAEYFCESTGYGWGIEVKSSSASNRSGIRFQTPEKHGHYFATNTPVKVKRRWADIYILALFKDDDEYSKSLLDSQEWEFYVTPASLLTSGSIGLSTLENIGVQPVPFSQLQVALERVIVANYQHLKSWKEQHDLIKREFIESVANPA